MDDIISFNEKYRQRTKKFAVAIVLFYSQHCKKEDETRIIGRQLLRSGTSAAANFRAVTRGRSNAESFSKLCIVVEEIDETLFWLELLEETNLIDTQYFADIKRESEELLKVFSATRKKWEQQ
jgi:four helix bundle protein